jgi:hypothetical protein
MYNKSVLGLLFLALSLAVSSSVKLTPADTYYKYKVLQTNDRRDKLFSPDLLRVILYNLFY